MVDVRLAHEFRTATVFINVTGTLPSIAAIEDVPLQTRARGRNMAELLEIIVKLLPNPTEGNPPVFLKGEGADAQDVAAHIGDATALRQLLLPPRRCRGAEGQEAGVRPPVQRVEQLG